MEFTNTKFVEYLKQAAKQNVRYWYGTTGYKCTIDLYNRKKAQYPQYYTEERTTRYKKDAADKRICVDCIGLLKSFFWCEDPFNFLASDRADYSVKNHYAANGMSDSSANGYFSEAKSKGMEWGTINSIPEIPGVAVTYSGHIGYYIGNGLVVEARGFNYGVVTTRLEDRAWTYWYRIPVIDYQGAFNNDPVYGETTLKKGMRGNAVKQLQQNLIKLGYNLGKYGADGDFGNMTENAVKSFQTTKNLKADGIVGQKTYAAITEALNNTNDFKYLGTRTLRKNNIGEDVKELQTALIKLGYNLGNAGADGEFGNKTENAVKAFQANCKLTIDGIFGKKSFETLKNKIG